MAHACNPVDGWEEGFREKGYRITKPRQVILSVLQKSPEHHLSAEAIYLRVHKTYPNIGLTTVYRNLDLLVKMDMVKRCDFGEGRATFELAHKHEGAGHHHHLVCLGCREIIDFEHGVIEEDDFMTKAVKGLTERYKFKITDHVLQFQGLCRSCQK